MGKLILGILAVFVLQIAFTIYLATDMNSIPKAEVAHVPALDDRVVEPVVGRSFGQTTSSDPPRTNAADLGTLARAEHATDSPRIQDKQRQIRTDDTTIRRVYRFTYARTPFRRSGSANIRNLSATRKEFFGNMVVETTFVASGNPERVVRRFKTRREVFGRMIVEHKFAI